MVKYFSWLYFINMLDFTHRQQCFDWTEILKYLHRLQKLQMELLKKITQIKRVRRNFAIFEKGSWYSYIMARFCHFFCLIIGWKLIIDAKWKITLRRACSCFWALIKMQGIKESYQAGNPWMTQQHQWTVFWHISSLNLDFQS